MANYNVSGELLTDHLSKQTVDVLVASSEADSSIKANANYVCTGTNDEIVIQQAITYVANKGGGKLRLSEGRFYIDSFPLTDNGGDHVALMLPVTSSSYSMEIVGAALPFRATKTTVERGTTIRVTATAYEACSASARYTLLRCGYVSSWESSSIHLSLSDVEIQLPSNQKPIMCVDLYYTSRVLIERIQCRAYTIGYNGITSRTDLSPAVANCVGFRAVHGSNNGVLVDMRNCLAVGFYEGFKLGGEHVIGINLATIANVYGYTFGNYTWFGKFLHPITLINCCDEHNVNYPLFVANGDTNTNGKQAVTLIDFNTERVASAIPGGVIGDYAKETVPNSFCGSINYTICETNYTENKATSKFWEDGSGHGFVSRNDAQALAGTSTERRTYAPNYMQSFYDTTVNKMLWCIDTANKTWVDAQGNTVA